METSGSALGVKVAADAEPPKANKETTNIMAKEKTDKRRTKKIPLFIIWLESFPDVIIRFRPEDWNKSNAPTSFLRE